MQITGHIAPDNLMSLEAYSKWRKEHKAEVMAHRKLRSVALGEHISIQFESETTIRYQIQEMLRIEKGGDEQIPGELAAYNPLIPQGDELIATLMLEIEDEKRRNAVLLTLGGIEETVFLEIGGDVIHATPTEYDDRTTADGKTSSVHWLRFKLTPEQIAHFHSSTERVVLGVSHKNYGHMAVLGDETRTALGADFA